VAEFVLVMAAILTAEGWHPMLRQDWLMAESLDVTWLIGVDEAGRGPLAGPVYAAAVAMRRDFMPVHAEDSRFSGVDDSKKMRPAARKRVAGHLAALCREEPVESEALGIHASVSSASVEEIEELNVLGATKLAMHRALKGLFLCLERAGETLPSHAIVVDGLPLKGFEYPHHACVKGDGKSRVIALASVLAKEGRDDWMRSASAAFPEYEWERNMGYGTSAHLAALRRHGPCPIHRRSFLKGILGGEDAQLSLPGV
jgi:ribonuclease HII